MMDDHIHSIKSSFLLLECVDDDGFLKENISTSQYFLSINLS